MAMIRTNAQAKALENLFIGYIMGIMIFSVHHLFLTLHMILRS
jgi:hypothetical protein